MKIKNQLLVLAFLLSVGNLISQSHIATSHYYDENGKTTLINAIIAKDSKTIKELMADNILINLPEKKGLQATPLMYAASLGQYVTCELLIENGAAIDQLDKNKDHALNWATFSGRLSIMKLLLNQDTDVTIKSKHGTAVDVALRLWQHDSLVRIFRQTKIAEPLQSKEIKLVNAIIADNNLMVQKILKKGILPDTMDELGIPVLQLAAQKGNSRQVKQLLDFGANPNILNRVGQTPLAWAARFGHGAVVDLLLRSGADPNIAGVDYVLTPLIGAALGGNTAIGKLLIDHGALMNHKDKINNAAAVHWALFYGNVDFVKMLVRKGVDPNEKALGNNQYSAYDMAKGYKNEALLSFLDSTDLARRKQELRGSWKVREIQYKYPDTTYIVNDLDYGRFLFSDKNYALMYNPSMQKRQFFNDLSKPEDREVVSAFRTIVFNSGTYAIENDVIKTVPDIAKVPGFEGGKQFYKVNIIKNNLELTMFDETYPNGTKPDWAGKLQIKFLLIRE